MMQMTRFSMKLWTSRYDKKMWREILLSGMKGFKRLERLEAEGRGASIGAGEKIKNKES